MIGRAAGRRSYAWAIPVLLAVTGTLEYALEDLAAPPSRTLPYLYAAIAALLVRRRFPFGGPVAALGVMGAESVVLGGELVVDPVTTLFLALYCFFLVAADNDERRAVAGAAAGLVVVAVMSANTPDLGALWLAFICALLLVGWGSGLVYGRRERHAFDLEARGERLEQEAATAVTDERSRIAREIHDIVSHSVSVMVLQARGGRRSLRTSPDEARQAFDAIESAGQQALAELRRLLGIIRDDADAPALAPQPGLAGLGDLLEQVRGAGMPVALEVAGDPTTLPAGVDLAAYRVIQESLTNALKHAGGTQACVTIRYAPGGIDVEVSDDGHGVGSTSGTGRGLVGMRERVTLYGGTIHTGNVPSGGYRVSVQLPVAAPLR